MDQTLVLTAATLLAEKTNGVIRTNARSRPHYTSSDWDYPIHGAQFNFENYLLLSIRVIKKRRTRVRVSPQLIREYSIRHRLLSCGRG